MRKFLANILSLLLVAPALAFDLPQGAVILTSPSQIKSYQILGQYGKTGEPGSYLYGTPKSPSLGAIHFVQAQAFTLSGSGSSIGATQFTLRSFNNVDGTNLNMSDFGEKGFGTIEPNNTTQQEQISFTSTTRNANGTVTLKGVSTVSNVFPYTETSGLATTHPGGATFVLSNTVGLYNTLANKYNNETITGTWTFNAMPRTITSTTIATSPAQFVNLYQLSLATSTGGGVNASTIVKGVSQEATDAELQAGTGTGSTGARLFAGGASHNQTSTANKVPVSNGAGIIDGSWFNASTSLRNIATTTPGTPNRIPITSATGTLAVTWIATSTTSTHQFLRSSSTPYWGDLGVAQSNSSTLPRDLNNTYINSSTFPLLVTITVLIGDGNGVATLDVYVSSTVNNAMVVARVWILDGDLRMHIPVTFIVPPGWSYRTVTTISGTAELSTSNWYEMQM